MAISLVQGWTGFDTHGIGNNIVTNFSGVAAGNLLVQIVLTEFSSAASPTYTVVDDTNGSWGSPLVSIDGGSFGVAIYRFNVTAGATFTSITTTSTTANSFFSTHTAELTGQVATSSTSADDATNSSSGTSTTPSSGAASVSVNGGYLIAGVSQNQTNTITVASPWTPTDAVVPNTGADADFRTGNIGSYSADWTLTVNAGWWACVAAFKAAAGGAPPFLLVKN